MATFFMFGKYSVGALNEISAERTDKATGLIEQYGGKVDSMYALLGERDLVLIADFPETEQAARASVALAKATGISFSTTQAIAVEDFDKIVADV